MKYYKAINDKDMIFANRTKAPAYMKGLALWIKRQYKQESVLFEAYSNGEYKAQLLFDFGKTVEL